MKGARFLGHSVHPMLITFPLGLLPTAIIFDVIHFASKNPLWSTVSYWMIAAGIVGALVAALFGLIDWLAIPGGTRARGVGARHGIGNVVVVAFFAVSWWMRRADPGNPTTAAFIVALLGGGVALYTGWLGGELVERHGLGVHDGANENAPSSLSGRPASEGSARRV